MAATLATRCWNDQLRTRLIRQGTIWVAPEERIEHLEEQPQAVLTRAVDGYLQKIGVKVKEQYTKPSARGYVPKQKRPA